MESISPQTQFDNFITPLLHVTGNREKNELAAGARFLKEMTQPINTTEDESSSLSARIGRARTGELQHRGDPRPIGYKGLKMAVKKAIEGKVNLTEGEISNLMINIVKLKVPQSFSDFGDEIPLPRLMGDELAGLFKKFLKLQPPSSRGIQVNWSFG